MWRCRVSLKASCVAGLFDYTGGVSISGAQGRFGPNNTMTERGSSFHLQCMPNDYWMTRGSYWYIFFTLTSVVCRVYAARTKGGKSDSSCSPPNVTAHHDLASRFSAYRLYYVLMLDVKNASRYDAGLYVCAQPPFYRTLGHLGLVAFVGVVCELNELTSENL